MNTIQVKENSVNAELSVYLYKDDSYPNGDMYIAYCPELDLTGYDDTIEGSLNYVARKSNFPSPDQSLED